MAILKAVCFLCLAVAVVEAFDPYAPPDTTYKGEDEVTLKDVVFLIRSQSTPWHLIKAQATKADIEQQARIQKLGAAEVYLLHEQYNHIGYWTLLPLITRLHKDFGSYKWLFFCEEDSRVSITGLLNVLSRYDSQKDWFLARGLHDKSATIIHHFRFIEDTSKFKYPDFEAGWLFSQSLLKSLAARWESEEHKADFAIDVKHELAYYIWNDGKGTSVTHIPEFCAGNVGLNLDFMEDDIIAEGISTSVNEEPQKCVTAHPSKLPMCGEPVSQDDVLFAVKTCEKFHKDRVPIVKKTWGQYAANIIYVSDIEDSSIPTVASGVPNTERGHCGKSMAIFKMFRSDAKYAQHKWLMLTDDDTILSVARVQKLLACYDSNDAVVLGERYGYAHMAGYGYDYLTGGGGMVFSRAAVNKLLDSGCSCGKDEDPDDMIIGMCTKRYNIPVTHSPLFHQARPDDYSEGFLQHQTPVSFHKHWNNDPIQVYQDWFMKDDMQLFATKEQADYTKEHDLKDEL
ncbi:beta-1,3-glucosyltransferase-like [Amphiura filiformis]|uniref:beta-1,3-glucosyltransferase-like n=1 Tax=Amphiura filiformis TaxID=82378 RepID=UPI003B210932